MSRMRWLLLAIFLIAVWNMNLRPRVINLDEEQDLADPAVAAMTTDNSRDWGGMDRWAFPGLEAWRITARLQKAGFSCLQPQDVAVGGLPRSGIHSLHCQQEKSWPLQRWLSIEARIDYNAFGGRLLSASAHSVVQPAAWREQMARLLRGLHLMEPAELQISGLVARDGDALARIVADAMLGNQWDAFCGDIEQTALCRSNLKARAQGFPALPATAWPVAELKPLLLQLRAIGFVPLRHVADSDTFMAVRLHGSMLWVDLARTDLTGHAETMAIAIAPVGAAATRLVLDGRGGRHEFALAGKASTYRDGAEQKWLFPLLAGAFVGSDDELRDEAGRKAVWLYPPAPEDSEALQQGFRKNIGLTDPAFQPQLLTAYMDRLLQDHSPEMQLQLQPPLQTADRLAQALRTSGIADLLTKGEADALMQQHYSGEKTVIARAAWALYRCEGREGDFLFIEPGCWQHFLQQDAPAAALLQADLQRQLRIYRDLDPANPVQKRLRRLATVFEITGRAP